MSSGGGKLALAAILGLYMGNQVEYCPAPVNDDFVPYKRHREGTMLQKPKGHRAKRRAKRQARKAAQKRNRAA